MQLNPSLPVPDLLKSLPQHSFLPFCFTMKNKYSQSKSKENHLYKIQQSYVYVYILCVIL